MNVLTIFIFIIAVSYIIKINFKEYLKDNKSIFLVSLLISTIVFILSKPLILLMGFKYSLLNSLITSVISIIYSYFIIDDTIDIKKLGMLLLMFFLFMYFGSLVVTLFGINASLLSDANYYNLSTFLDFLFLILLLFIYFKDYKEMFKDFIKNFKKYSSTAFSYWSLGLIIMIVSNTLISTFVTSASANNEASVQSMISIVPLTSFISAGILAPIIEETIFRKTFYDAFKKNKWLYVLSSGLVFGGLHVIGQVNRLEDLLYIIPYSALGLTFALTHYETKNTFPTIMIHTIHNSILVGISILSILVG